jgi:hypothetical protein
MNGLIRAHVQQNDVISIRLALVCRNTSLSCTHPYRHCLSAACRTNAMWAKAFGSIHADAGYKFRIS